MEPEMTILECIGQVAVFWAVCLGGWVTDLRMSFPPASLPRYARQRQLPDGSFFGVDGIGGTSFARRESTKTPLESWYIGDNKTRQAWTRRAEMKGCAPDEATGGSQENTESQDSG